MPRAPHCSHPLVPIASTLVILGSLFAATPLQGGIVPGRRLPVGAEHTVRAREIDILSLSAYLRFDLSRERITGEASIRFTPLRAGLKSIALDAFELKINRVEIAGASDPPSYRIEERQLRIDLPRPAAPGEELTVRIG